MFTGKYKILQGKLVPSRQADRLAMAHLLTYLKEGDEVEVFIDSLAGDGTLAQLAKLHAMIRDLAAFTGNAVQGLKLMIKDRSGLCFTRDQELICKSFGDCSREELGVAINACIELAAEVGLPLH